MERSHNLLEGGANIPVTSETRRVTRNLTRSFSWSGRARGRWTTSRKASLGAEELEVLVTGTSELDFDKLAKTTEYDGGYGKDHCTILAFWRAVGRMPAEEQRHLLMFVTGSKEDALGGLGELTFKIQRAGSDSDQRPTARTCFNNQSTRERKH
ncbi:conserved unknown protein [Ectocarpus siliculosus]|uniref:HECT-type E3 ubiquitin transferase n=1 Tax=Ectocarpus siliculosus TaxID=2880 RepID=D7FSE3_ECTSI|nr:conserved unknown protein [Ectocarpus siliculosus]|eukprot:CBJ31084.1 conserved unknown protein [Ectocarpus siliculosus]